jgi:hypothetical protein
MSTKTKKPTLANKRALETIIVKLETLQARVGREHGYRLGEAKHNLIQVLRNW